MSKQYLALIISSLLVPNFVFATEQDKEIETIQVVEKRLPYRGNVSINDLPQSVSVVSSDLLNDIGVKDFQNAVGLVSAISRQNNFGGLWESFAIRGFAGDENLPSAYLINGFSAGRGYSGLRDTSNIQSIEVLKGPGSALYGRSEPGGTVNIITKKPQFEQSGYIALTAGEFAQRRVEADYTNGLTDSVAFRINGAYEKANSYRDTISSEKLALTPSFTFKVSDSTQVNYELEYVDQEIPFDRGIPVLPGLELPVERFLGEPSDGPIKVEATGHQFEISHQLNDTWMFNAGLGYRTSSLTGLSSDTELSPGRQLLYIDGKTLNRQRRYRDYDATDLSARLEISGDVQLFELNHNLLIGADVYDYELDFEQQRYRVAWGKGDSTYSINIFNPVYGQAKPAMSPTIHNLEAQKAWGVYLQDQIDVTDALQILVGARIDKFEQTVTNQLKQTASEQSQTEFNPRAGVVYRINKQLNWYSSYSEGFRPNAGADFEGNTFEPEKSQSLETGIKFTIANDTVRLNAALFKAEKSNILTVDPVNEGFSAALGKAQSNGVELDLAWDISNQTELSVSYAYTKAETANDMVNLDWGVQLPAGSQLINIPEHSANVILRHNRTLAGYPVDFGAHVQYVGTRLGETINPDYTLPAYTLVNLFFNVELTQDLGLQLKLDNAFDERYYANSYSHMWTMPGQPSKYSATLKYQF
ncbi:TonB-dependent siderophore receptor [Pseudoalteromonas luteoviolacea]|uniref:TonB-dependent siderophore receptor n=1 Tax=Pseudoalteromonas luteoviolacea TaxID=43657 RepID=UPI001E29D963|nr:TonB-dependent siderophore receptor [Pseudoalteromonas luteoviolacea]